MPTWSTVESVYSRHSKNTTHKTEWTKSWRFPWVKDTYVKKGESKTMNSIKRRPSIWFIWASDFRKVFRVRVTTRVNESLSRTGVDLCIKVNLCLTFQSVGQLYLYKPIFRHLFHETLCSMKPCVHFLIHYRVFLHCLNTHSRPLYQTYL